MAIIARAYMQAEAPAVFMPTHRSVFILGSHLTGWYANPAILFRTQAASLCDARMWLRSSPAIGPGRDTTFESQAAAVFPYVYDDGTVLFVYMGDRWNAFGPGSVRHCPSCLALCSSTVRWGTDCVTL